MLLLYRIICDDDVAVKLASYGLWGLGPHNPEDYAAYFVLGSATSRKPSPNRLIAKTVAAMHRPGAIICYGYSSK